MIKGILASFLITLTFLGCAAPSVNPAVGIDHPGRDGRRRYGLGIFPRNHQNVTFMPP